MHGARPEPPWPVGPAAPVLPDDRVHVWSADLTCPPSALPALLAVLSPDERARADRFRFERDRRRFVVGRATLRAVLAAYLGVESEALGFRYGAAGKPLLGAPANAATLQFSVSHAGDLALYAVTSARAVGVDVERVRCLPDHDRIAARFFSAPERSALRSRPPEVQQVAFFNCWTRKEACLKAWGDGLSFPLDAFAVTLAPGDAARVLWIRGGVRQASRWHLRHLIPFPGHVAALAVEGGGWDLCCWSYRAPWAGVRPW